MGPNRRTSVDVNRPKDQTRAAIERMEAEREARRQAIKNRKLERLVEEKRNLAAGNPGDVDFIGLVRKWRDAHASTARPLSAKQQPKICICVRKRPVSERERKKRDHDSITCLHPTVWVHSAKVRVDGITKYLDHNSFRFDYSFDEVVATEDVYQYTAMGLVDFVCSGRGGRATVFAYGQTGSGKTYTMAGIQAMVADDIFDLLSSQHSDPSRSSFENTQVTVSFFELYGGRIQDLLNNGNRLKLLEDGKGEVVISGLEEFEANDSNQLMDLVEKGNRNRTTHATEANDTSSRSHAICQIILREKGSGKLRGKMSLVDLAGSERGSDTKSHNRQRRTESAEINKSLLALKECIRALDGKNTGIHVPYRASKLTLILKDCFTSKLARTTMIVTVSPGASSADHTLNTLRYADRVKEKKVAANSSEKKEDPEKSKPTSRKIKQPPVSPLNYPSPPTRDLSPHQNHEIESDDMKQTDLDDVSQFDTTIQNLIQEEENLLNLHMSVIQTNAELLTEEGRLLQAVQGDVVGDYDIDKYASRLGNILDHKTTLIHQLQGKLHDFRSQLVKEEELNKQGGLPKY